MGRCPEKRIWGFGSLSDAERELVTSLIQPWNADICRSQLRIHIEGKPEIQTLAARAREAIAEVIGTWAMRPRLKERPLIDLDAERMDEGPESRERLRIDDLRASLSQGRRIILEAPAGRGKTTTLIQIAQRTLAEGGLPEWTCPFWVRTGTDALRFVAHTPAFAKRG